MVCIIDDREDVWNFASNLVHVKPYQFFKDVGDINAPLGRSPNEAITSPVDSTDDISDTREVEPKETCCQSGNGDRKEQKKNDSLSSQNVSARKCFDPLENGSAKATSGDCENEPSKEEQLQCKLNEDVGKQDAANGAEERTVETVSTEGASTLETPEASEDGGDVNEAATEKRLPRDNHLENQERKDSKENRNGQLEGVTAEKPLDCEDEQTTCQTTNEGNKAGKTIMAKVMPVCSVFVLCLSNQVTKQVRVHFNVWETWWLNGRFVSLGGRQTEP